MSTKGYVRGVSSPRGIGKIRKAPRDRMVLISSICKAPYDGIIRIR